MKHCAINVRMKSHYEKANKFFLTKRTPVIIRIDGKSFRSYCKNLKKPFDEGLMKDMNETAKFLCAEVQGAKCAYVQSDEISLLLTDYDKLDTNAWFDYNVQKLASVTSSMATAKFNAVRLKHRVSNIGAWGEDLDKYFSENLAFFDARCFNIPKEEVANYFIGRQRDAIKNSVQMMGQQLFSSKQLHGKHCDKVKEMCAEKGHIWEQLPIDMQRGRFIIKNEYWNDELLTEFDDRFFTDTIMRFKDKPVFTIIGGFPCAIDSHSVKIRTKWEAVETPLFSNKDFEKWLKM